MSGEVFDVMIHGALRESFEKWADDHDMVMLSLGDEEGTEQCVLVIKPDSALAKRFEAMP